MGPRPRGRGIMSTASGTRPTALRFNGAATARSRNSGDTSRTDRRRGRASMGPRPRGRGISNAVVAIVPAGTASMGPRPRGRGILFLPDEACAVRPCFNGAATARSRNWSGIWKSGGSLPASMGPRPRGRGIGNNLRRVAGISELQWGRDRAVAEFKSRCPELPGQVMLQWGRDRAVAEFRSRLSALPPL